MLSSQLLCEGILFVILCGGVKCNCVGGDVYYNGHLNADRTNKCLMWYCVCNF